MSKVREVSEQLSRLANSAILRSQILILVANLALQEYRVYQEKGWQAPWWKLLDVTLPPKPLNYSWVYHQQVLAKDPSLLRQACFAVVYLALDHEQVWRHLNPRLPEGEGILAFVKAVQSFDDESLQETLKALGRNYFAPIPATAVGLLQNAPFVQLSTAPVDRMLL